MKNSRNNVMPPEELSNELGINEARLNVPPRSTFHYLGLGYLDFADLWCRVAAYALSERGSSQRETAKSAL